MEDNAVKLKDFVDKYGNGDTKEYVILSKEFDYSYYGNSADMLTWVFSFLDDFLSEIKKSEHEKKEEVLETGVNSILAASGILAKTYMTKDSTVHIMETLLSILEDIMKTAIENDKDVAMELGKLLINWTTAILVNNLTEEEFNNLTEDKFEE